MPMTVIDENFKKGGYENFLHKGCLEKKGGVTITRIGFKPHCIQCLPHGIVWILNGAAQYF